MERSKLNYLLFLLLACLWSGSFIGIKALVTVWSPLFSGALRIGIALLCMWVLIICMRRSTAIEFSLRWKIWIIGLFSQGIPFALLFWGEHLISAGLAGILNATVSIWAFLFSAIFLPQLNSYSFRKILGLVIGIIGVTIVFWPMLTFSKNSGALYGAAAILVMAISYAVGALLNQFFLMNSKTRVDFFANIYHQYWASFIFLLLISCFEPLPSFDSLFHHAALLWCASLYLGILSTALAWVIYYHLIREWDAVRASAVMYIVPVLTLTWDYLLFSNRPYLSEVLGVAVILVGVVLIQLSSYKRIAHLHK